MFITIPHTLASDVASIIDSQRTTNFSIIASIAAIASVIAVVLLRWNKTLQRIVMQKTSQLQESVDKLTNANDELKHHEQMQKEFINVAAHELRTPTQAISGNLELIEMMYLPSLFESPQGEEKKQETFDKEIDQLAKDKDKQQQFRSGLVSTYRNSQRLERLVNNILDVSRIESKKLQLDKEHFNLNEKIRNVIKDIYGKQRINSLSSYREKFINIDFQPSEDPITVYADKIRIFEVISNLLTNAIKYSNGKPVIITVKKIHRNTIDLKHQQNGNEVGKDNTKGNKDETFVVVSIRDKGKGINLEILPRLFTKFTTKSSQGTGLGLYLAKSIIEAHGGQIWAQNNSDEEKGATFSFTLPLDN
ncbi:sensor histidine kinase [Candidatus Nitrosocosmicus sp. FF01]|uniref:sensor histidine kinase n=1 Tax=Candidatus Nitrosocosmicus sp. FF01 TaxID=3397670 RepID=UPI0039EC352F